MCEEDGKGDRETNSSSLDLDQLEVKIYGNISQELQTDSSYVASLESNIKLFRTTVRKIFDTFNHSMSDFEQYKERFENILSKSNEETIAEMEEFIKDMFEHITSSDSSLSHFTSKSMQQSSDKDSNIAVKPDSSRGSDTETSFEGFKTTIEAYKNDNYKTDSTSGENSSNDKSKTDAFCINFLNNNRCVQIKLNNRNLLSEINIRDSKQKEDIVEVASAENIKKLQAKRLEVDSITQRSENYFTEKNIPVKISNPKKNIHLNEDFTNDDEDKEDNRSIFYKICNFLCRKLRKNV
ncbi:uncharacterized protein [Battus philenor]|uniref:uncharacterized protein n=1 Tax=Battus philenor TaxID=42288 RepID=UPI0035D0D06C